MSTPQPAAGPAPGPATDAAPEPGTARRRRLTLAGVSWRTAVVLLVLAYALLVSLFTSSGQTQSFGTPDIPPGGVLVQIAPSEVRADIGVIDVVVRIQPSPQLLDASTGTLRRDLVLIVGPTAGTQQTRYTAGDFPAVIPFELLATGDVEDWPLDRYVAGVQVLAFDVGPGGRREVPSKLYVDGNLVGWKFTAEAPTADVATPGVPEPDVVLIMRRAGSTLAFGAILVATLVTLPVLSLFVSIAAYRRRRRVEPTLASWMAAMLFATVPLRNFLPGSPPAGSWIDVTVVLWVIVALVASLAIYVAAWWRTSPPPPAP